MKISTIVKGGFCVLGLVSVGNLFAAPANADQASARGAVTIVRPSGSSFSVSGELTAPSGTQFTGPALTVTPTATGAGTNAEVATLSIDPGAPIASTSGAATLTVEGATAAKITAATATTVEDVATLVRAARSGALE
ncbi:hypothetical protein [Fortiea contorta]|uniref:hypothetical protein n=1 Tax=Fortiea contorta TaxID=1892405 RepID=UPI00034D3AC2|nr:hypothetical protein [Fortiea contorta]